MGITHDNKAKKQKEEKYDPISIMSLSLSLSLSLPLSLPFSLSYTHTLSHFFLCNSAGLFAPLAVNC